METVNRAENILRTPEMFVRWVMKQPSEGAIAQRVSMLGCPIHNFLSDQFPNTTICVTKHRVSFHREALENWVGLADTAHTILENPDWVQAFIEAVDAPINDLIAAYTITDEPLLSKEYMEKLQERQRNREELGKISRQEVLEILVQQVPEVFGEGVREEILDRVAV